jgi:hypothetical protein
MVLSTGSAITNKYSSCLPGYKTAKIENKNESPQTAPSKLAKFQRCERTQVGIGASALTFPGESERLNV